MNMHYNCVTFSAPTPPAMFKDLAGGSVFLCAISKDRPLIKLQGAGAFTSPQGKVSNDLFNCARLDDGGRVHIEPEAIVIAVFKTIALS
jgi:hypothetical protein